MFDAKWPRETAGRDRAQSEYYKVGRRAIGTTP